MTAHDNSAPFTTSEPGFLVDSACGRQWFVPLTAVGQDYAEFLMQADHLDAAAAAAKVQENEEFLPTWFAEQINDFATIERLGRLVRTSTLFKTKQALDRRRGSYRRDYTELNIPAPAH